MVYWAVAKGREIGIYKTWGDCRAQVQGFPDKCYDRIKLKKDAEKFIRANNKDYEDPSVKIPMFTLKPTSEPEISKKELKGAPTVYTNGVCHGKDKDAKVRSITFLYID